MASEIHGKIMSEYTPLNELTQQEQVTYLSNAAVTTFGKTSTGGKNTNVNVPLSTLVPSVPVSDVTVNGSSVVSDGVAAITVPTTSVPDPGSNLHRGEFLKVNNEDDIVWSAVPVPELRGSDTVTYDASNSGALAVKYNTNTLDEDSTHGLTVKLPVPDTTVAHEGDVLTVDSNGDIDWVAPSGGGGGNPYTKVTVVPSDPYSDGQDPWEVPLYSQDLVISNNTYSIASKPLGTKSNGDAQRISNAVKIKLPGNTDFPMSVVEFSMNSENESFTNNIKVYVGNTELTKMYSAPYNDGILVSRESFTTAKSYEIQLSASGNTYTAHENYTIGKQQGISGGTLVQVHIFGNCYRVETNKSTAVGS